MVVPSISYDSTVLFQQRSSLREDGTIVRGNVINKIVRIYVETKVDIYRRLGRDFDKVEAYISNLFNQVAVLYLNEDIMIGVSMLCMWKGGDPYSGTDAYSLLGQFQNENTSINGDLGILLSFRGKEEGIAAGFEGLCNSSTSNKLAVAMGLEKEHKTVPVYSYSVFVVSHELGHLFGSRHTHACVWNGDSTAIDGCAGYIEPRESGYYCVNPGYPSGKGTIMSYCNFKGRPGVDFNLGFGPQPGNVIRDKVRNASCLQPCTTNLTNQTITTNKTITTGCNINLQNITVTNGITLTIESGGNINVQNVNVQNGSKLILDAAGEIILGIGFEVELGAEFETK
jgi:hypothetical protein